MIPSTKPVAAVPSIWRAVVVVLLSWHAGALGAQRPDTAGTSSDTMKWAAAAQAGTADGRAASVTGSRWRAAAATFFLTPIVGGVGVLVSASHPPASAPATVPQPFQDDSVAARRYRDAFRAAYLPRRTSEMRRAMVITTAVFAVAAALLSDHGHSAK